MTRRVSVVFVVDTEGRLLLQLRDERAPIAAGQWALPGGHLEPGEDPEHGARREVREETGLCLPAPLALFWHGERLFDPQAGAATRWWVYWSTTTAGQEQIVVGEGAAMRFVAPEELPRLPLAIGAAYFLDLFLGSAQYARAAAAGRRQEPAAEDPGVRSREP